MNKHWRLCDCERRHPKSSEKSEPSAGGAQCQVRKHERRHFSKAAGWRTETRAIDVTWERDAKSAESAPCVHVGGRKSSRGKLRARRVRYSQTWHILAKRQFIECDSQHTQIHHENTHKEHERDSKMKPHRMSLSHTSLIKDNTRMRYCVKSSVFYIYYIHIFIYILFIYIIYIFVYIYP